MSGDDRATWPRCRRCGGEVMVVLRRAWCMRTYAEGGCGGYWSNWRTR